MKQLLSIATAAFLTCGLVGARASAGDCNSCDTCGSYGKKSFFGGFFHKKSCGDCNTCSTPVSTSYGDCCDDPCKKKKHFGFSFFGKKDCNSCGCDSAPVYTNDCCEDSCGKKKHRWFGRNNDCGCDDGCGKRLSLPKINFFKRGCGCETSYGGDCCGNGHATYGGVSHGTVIHSAPASGGVIIHQAPATGTLAPVPGTPVQPAQPILRPVQPAPVPAPPGSSAPVPVPAGS